MAGKMDPSQDFPRWSREKKFSFGHMINLLLIKLFRSRWLYISLVPLCTFIDLKRRMYLGQLQYPAILSTRLVNKAYGNCYITVPVTPCVFLSL